MICANCNQTIYVECGHHRSCDEDVCSERCALALMNYISSFDPELNSPLEWKHPKKEIMGPPKKYGLSTNESSYRLPTLVQDCERQDKPAKLISVLTFVVSLLRLFFL